MHYIFWNFDTVGAKYPGVVLVGISKLLISLITITSIPRTSGVPIDFFVSSTVLRFFSGSYHFTR